MTVLIDTPLWPAHGRLWAHLVSDHSLGELHEFAEANEIPARGFDLDHYDVPEELHEHLVVAGAVHVSGGELVRRLIGSGLRIPARDRARHRAVSSVRVTSRVTTSVSTATVHVATVQATTVHATTVHVAAPHGAVLLK